MSNTVERVLEALTHNGFHAMYADTAAIACQTVLRIIPPGATVGFGDSASIRQLRLPQLLASQARILVDPFERELCRRCNNGEISKVRRAKIYRFSLQCEYFMTGSNAVTQTGELVNIDGTGNRVSGMIFGPERIIVVVGLNKIVKDYADAYHRLTTVIVPHHAKAMGYHPPCVTTQQCVNCKGKDKQCSMLVRILQSPEESDCTVLLVNEDLGLAWDQDWPEKRRQSIYDSYNEVTWLRLGKSAAEGE